MKAEVLAVTLLDFPRFLLDEEHLFCLNPLPLFRMWLGCASDAARMWLGCGSDVGGGPKNSIVLL